MSRRIPTLVSLTLAIAIAAHGWWFDYSDRAVHNAVALLVACLVVRFPRSAVITGGVWLALIAAVWFALPRPSPDVREGTSEAVVRAFVFVVFSAVQWVLVGRFIERRLRRCRGVTN